MGPNQAFNSMLPNFMKWIINMVLQFFSGIQLKTGTVIPRITGVLACVHPPVF
jgi:hypothetical protein